MKFIVIPRVPRFEFRVFFTLDWLPYQVWRTQSAQQFIHSCKENITNHTLWNTNSIVQDLNSGWHVHVLQWPLLQHEHLLIRVICIVNSKAKSKRLSETLGKNCRISNWMNTLLLLFFIPEYQSTILLILFLTVFTKCVTYSIVYSLQNMVAFTLNTILVDFNNLHACPKKCCNVRVSLRSLYQITEAL